MSNDEEDIIDSHNRMLCGKHRREVCQLCCVDHRITNEIMKIGKDADIDAIMARHDRIQRAEHRAMAQLHIAQGGNGTITLGTEECQRLYDEVASRPGQQMCLYCGMKSDKLQLCRQCKEARYCNQECQKKDWKSHKKSCKAKAKALAEAEASGSGIESSAKESRKKELISWKQLEDMQGATARNRVLELRVMSQPIPFLRWCFDGKDFRKNNIEFDSEAPKSFLY